MWPTSMHLLPLCMTLLLSDIKDTSMHDILEFRYMFCKTIGVGKDPVCMKMELQDKWYIESLFRQAQKYEALYISVNLSYNLFFLCLVNFFPIFVTLFISFYVFVEKLLSKDVLVSGLTMPFMPIELQYQQYDNQTKHLSYHKIQFSLPKLRLFYPYCSYDSN